MSTIPSPWTPSSSGQGTPFYSKVPSGERINLKKHPNCVSAPSITATDEKVKPSLDSMEDAVLSTITDQTPNIPRDTKQRTRKLPISSIVKGKVKEDRTDLVGQVDPAGHRDMGCSTVEQSTPPMIVKPQRIEPDATRKLRQEQQRQRKEQWQRKFVGEGQEECPKSAEEQKLGLVEENAKCEVELLTNGQF